MKEKLGSSKNIKFIEPEVKILSALTIENKKQIEAVANVFMEPSEHLAGKKEDKPKVVKHHFACKICGFVVEFEGESLPADFVCPICKHPASDFEKID